MKVKILVFFCFLLFLPSILFAISDKRLLARVEAVQNKDVLDNTDLQTIDTFVDEGIRELLDSQDFSTISNLRNQLITYSSSKKASSAMQYRTQFVKSLSQYITEAFKASQKFPPVRRYRVAVNLLMIIDSLRDVQLSSIALDKLSDSNGAIRYSALKCFTNPDVIKQLNDSANSSLLSQVISRLNNLVQNCNDSMLILITNFASDIQADESTRLVITIASLRNQQYIKWQVKDEMTDSIVLKALYNKIISKQNVPETARSFAQLYSYIYQRYIKGDSLSESHKQKLISVMIDVEDKYVSKLLGRQTKIRDALSKKDNDALTAEFESLLGSANTEGRFGAKFGFLYRSPEGKETTAPLPLPPPPPQDPNKINFSF